MSREPDYFLMSREWRAVRMIALERDGARCACCGRTAGDGIVINVDHIKNRYANPELALTPSNLQVLCNECNHGKGNKYSTDWRTQSPSTSKWVSQLIAPLSEYSTGPNDDALISNIWWLLKTEDPCYSEQVQEVAEKIKRIRADSPWVSVLRSEFCTLMEVEPTWRPYDVAMVMDQADDLKRIHDVVIEVSNGEA